MSAAGGSGLDITGATGAAGSSGLDTSKWEPPSNHSSIASTASQGSDVTQHLLGQVACGDSEVGGDASAPSAEHYVSRQQLGRDVSHNKKSFMPRFLENARQNLVKAIPVIEMMGREKPKCIAAQVTPLVHSSSSDTVASKCCTAPTLNVKNKQPKRCSPKRSPNNSVHMPLISTLSIENIVQSCCTINIKEIHVDRKCDDAQLCNLEEARWRSDTKVTCSNTNLATTSDTNWGLPIAQLQKTGKYVHMDLRGALKGTESRIAFDIEPKNSRGHIPVCLLEYKGYRTIWEVLNPIYLKLFRELHDKTKLRTSHLVPILGFSIDEQSRVAQVGVDLMLCGSLLQILVNLDPQVRPTCNLGNFVDIIHRGIKPPACKTTPSLLVPEPVLSRIAYAILMAIRQRRGNVCINRSTMNPHKLCFAPDGRIQFLDVPFSANVLNMTCDTQILVEFFSYLPPEQLLAKSRLLEASSVESLEAGDIWALGMMILESATGFHPFLAATEHGPMELIRLVGEQDGVLFVPESHALHSHLSPEFHDFVSLCLKHDMKERPTPTELLEHKFITSPLPYTMGKSSQEMRTGDVDEPQSTQQVVEAWLHDISIRQHSVKELARATISHFYQTIRSETTWGTKSRVAKLISEKTKVKYANRDGTTKRGTGVAETCSILQSIVAEASLQIKTTNITLPTSFTQCKVTCKVYGSVEKKPFKHTFVLDLPIIESPRRGVRIYELKLMHKY